MNRRRSAYWDKQASRYDGVMDFWDRHLFGDSRPWACGRAAGEVAAAHAEHAQRMVTRIEASGGAEASNSRYITEKIARNAGRAVETPEMPVAAQRRQEPPKERLGLSELKVAARARRVAVLG